MGGDNVNAGGWEEATAAFRRKKHKQCYPREKVSTMHYHRSESPTVIVQFTAKKQNKQPSSPSVTIMTLNDTIIELLQRGVDEEVSLLRRKWTEENNNGLFSPPRSHCLNMTSHLIRNMFHLTTLLKLISCVRPTIRSHIRCQIYVILN